MRRRGPTINETSLLPYCPEFKTIKLNRTVEIIWIFTTFNLEAFISQWSEKRNRRQRSSYLTGGIFTSSEIKTAKWWNFRSCVSGFLSFVLVRGVFLRLLSKGWTIHECLNCSEWIGSIGYIASHHTTQQFTPQPYFCTWYTIPAVSPSLTLKRKYSTIQSEYVETFSTLCFCHSRLDRPSSTGQSIGWFWNHFASLKMNIWLQTIQGTVRPIICIKCWRFQT